MLLVSKLVPPASAEQRRAALRAAGAYLLARGVTSVGDMGTFGDVDQGWSDLEDVYDAAAADGGLPVR